MDEGLELIGSDAGILKSFSISRIVVEGYDTSPPREDVEEALKEHFASRGIKLIHVSVPVVDDSRCLCRCALIYVNGECEAKALMLDGSYVGGRILTITAYPFDDNRLEHVFAPTKATDEYRWRTNDTSLAKDDIKKMLRGVFPGSGCMASTNGSALLYLRGQDAMDKALKLSGGSVGGFKFAVTEVLPVRVLESGITLATAIRFGYKVANSKTNQKMINTTD